MGGTTTTQPSKATGLNQIFYLNSEEEKNFKKIVQIRAQFRHPNLLTVRRFQILLTKNLCICQTHSTVKVYYDDFDFFLSEIKADNWLQSSELYKIIDGVCSALVFLQSRGAKHGDIRPEMICYKKRRWHLVDSMFIDNGISAYEKVIQGQSSFISPAQMQKLKQGTAGISPEITQADEIFALGMTCLEVMTKVPSRKCYRQSYLNLNENHIKDMKQIIMSKYSADLATLVISMISIQPHERPSFAVILDKSRIQNSRTYSKMSHLST